MAATQCAKPCALEMAQVITAIWPYSSAATRGVFSTTVLGIGGGALPDEDNLKTQILHNKNTITFNQMMTLVDNTVANYQIGLANLIDIAKRSSNAARLDFGKS